MRNNTRIYLFVGLLPLVYLTSLFLLSMLHFDGKPLLRSISHNYVVTGGWGHSLQRFREIDSYKDIDLLFLGSSHTYRGFDPRIFNSYGFSSFNMGSTSQTPLNSFFLLKKYFMQLNPKLVVLDVYPLLLSTDGIESYFDLVTNMSLNKEIVEMAFAVNNPQAIHSLIGSMLEKSVSPLNTISQGKINNDTYIPGGYCESSLDHNSSAIVAKNSTINSTETQINFLRKIIRYTLQHNAGIVLVVQPLPREYINTINNYAAVSRKIAEIARESNAVYIDYNDKITFSTENDFFDKDHLTASGVKKYNTIFIQDIEKYKLLPEKTRS